tara:strand:+ start:221 stop:754 length:534 start_codon:yes stop_codon:yes gene_type:complete
MNEPTNSPLMSKKEYEFLLSIFKQNDTVLEFGAGMSTLHFSTNVKSYISIEHDHIWFSNIKQKAQSNVSLYHADCFYKNNNVHCDYTSDTEKERWRPYFEMVHNIPKQKYSKVFIDGRARAYCATEVFDYLDDDGLLIIHDYSGRYKYHNIVESLYKKNNIIDSLAVFSKKMQKQCL